MKTSMLFDFSRDEYLIVLRPVLVLKRSPF